MCGAYLNTLLTGIWTREIWTLSLKMLYLIHGILNAENCTCKLICHLASDINLNSELLLLTLSLDIRTLPSEHRNLNADN